MLKGGIISESSSPWASPVVIVCKKDGSLCFCIDYRWLNAVTKKDVFPLPRIDDLLDQLQGKCVFSTFDSRRGYWQIPVSAESKQKTAFITHKGLFEFGLMPFGLCNAPATFQRLMQKILSGLGSFCNVYIEELWWAPVASTGSIWTPGEVRSEATLPEVSAGVAWSWVSGTHGLSWGGPSELNKIDAVRKFPVPICVRAVREFIWLCSYYKKFVPVFAMIASQLHQLLRKNVPLKWTEACHKVFQRLRSS